MNNKIEEKNEFTAANPSDAASFTHLVWSDEFDGDSLDSENWQYEVGPKGTWFNNELQGYTEGENAEVKDSCLVITAKDDLTSSRIISKSKKYFTYGKLTAKIKMSNGHGSWPAFWLLGQNDGTNLWPRCGEIDIMEHNNSDTFIYNTLHWNGDGWEAGKNASHKDSGTTRTDNVKGIECIDVSEWHEYSCVWTTNSIKMYVDDVQTFEMPITDTGRGLEAFHKPFYIIFNFAMGGDMPKEFDSAEFTGIPWQMCVDYVRLYQ